LSLWKIAPRRPSAPRTAAAALSASVTSEVRMWSVIDQPASRFEHRSNTVARGRVLGPDHPDTLRSANNLAVDLRALGQAAELDH
jgi:hypothetical protein